MAQQDADFEPDDHVRLKGGGRVMIVAEVLPLTSPYRYGCYWVEGGARKSDYFRAEELEPAPGPQAP